MTIGFATRRYVALTIGLPRTAWIDELAAGAASGQLAIDVVKCLSLPEVVARLRHGTPVSAVLVDHRTLGLDNDLVAEARAAGASVLGVGPDDDAWRRLGIVPLGATARPVDVLTALVDTAAALPDVEPSTPAPAPAATPWAGSLLAVTGGGGSGTSTIAIAIAQHFAAGPGARGTVCLADLCLDAQLGAFHDAPDVVPNLIDLIERLRRGAPTASDVRDLCFDVDARGYSLLLGTHRHHEWTALGPQSVAQVLVSLRTTFRHVVVDTHADFDGEHDSGSLDIEERNSGSRTATSEADLVVVTGASGFKGLLDLTRTIAKLRHNGIDAARIVPVVTGRPRSASARSEISKAIADVIEEPLALAAPIFVPRRGDVERSHLHGEPLPASLTRTLGPPLERLLDAAPQRHGTTHPQPVIPGSLGTLADPAA